MKRSHRQTFEGELIQGHKGVTVVLVPFDPARALGTKPVRLAGRRHGWLVKGRIERAPFEGYIGERWGRFFLHVDDELRERAKVSVGETIAVTVEPTDEDAVWEAACAQSTRTTQPSRPRSDAAVRDAPAPRRKK